MRGFLLPAITLTTLLAGSAAFSAQSSGVVGSYDRMERSFWITGHKYQLPETSRRSVRDGDRIFVEWDQVGDVRVVRLLNVEQANSDE